MRLSSLGTVSSGIIALTAAIAPYLVEWNTTHSYGPDGPWPVVTLQVGTSKDNVTLSWLDVHPGGIWQSMLLTQAFCNIDESPKPCLAEKAGLYNINASISVIRNVSENKGWAWQWGSDRAFNMSGGANNVVDGMTMYTVQGVVELDAGAISAVDKSQISLPGGTNYSNQVGSLSLGIPGNGFQGSPSGITGGSFPGVLRAGNITASNSFGLHYGSVPLGQVGSLVWGGYDQSRILGDVAAFDLGLDLGMLASLVDVQIGVETGSSPFEADSFEGLLKLNPRFTGIQPAVINPVVPYLFMSPETCAAIAEHLPLTLQPDIGLYIWETADPQYQKIVRSPAYLAFVFQSSGTGNVTIKVPFQLLNLTLEAPIVPSTQQYFPCRPLNAVDGRFFLGRALLQAAHIGINWEIKKWFLAQAPGPGMGAPNLQNIEPNNISIDSDPIANFAASWEKSWTILSEANKSTNSINSSSSAPSPPASASDSGLSKEAKIGVGLGTTLGVLGIGGVVVFLWFHLRRNKAVQGNVNVPEVQRNRLHEKDGRSHLEVGQGLTHEVGADNEIHEI